MGATKLTLTVKEESLPFVKKYAKRQHTSVSKLVQRLFDNIAENEKNQPDPLLEKYKDIEIPQWIKNLTYKRLFVDSDVLFGYATEKGAVLFSYPVITNEM